MKRIATRRTYLLIAGSLALGLALSACGANKSGTAPRSTTPAALGSSRGRPTGGIGPGASGSVTSVASSSMVVKSSQAGKITVGWTSSTTFTKAATSTRSALVKGACVTVTGSGSRTTAARAVAISTPIAGKCGTTTIGGGLARGGSRSSDANGGSNGTPPSEDSGGERSKTGPPGRKGGGSSAGTSFTIGKVMSLSGQTLVLSETSVAGSKTAATTVDVTLGSSTAYTEAEVVSFKDLALGDCVTATGASTAKVIRATSVRITSTGDKACTTGLASPAKGPTNG